MKHGLNADEIQIVKTKPNLTQSYLSVLDLCFIRGSLLRALCVSVVNSNAELSVLGWAVSPTLLWIG